MSHSMQSATTGKILGWFGLILLISSPYTYLIRTGSPYFAAAKALIGIALIAYFFATNYTQFSQFASRKSSLFFTTTALMMVFAVGALAAVNYIGAKKNKTWDLTNKKIYTLHPQTVSTLKGLKEPVKAIGFVTSSHPGYDALENLFERYHREAPDKFEYVFKDPKKNPDLAAKYQLKEGQATVVLTKGAGEKESHTALNVISEQELTNALLKMNAVGEQKVYFIAGHGEWPLEKPAGNPMQADPEAGSAALSELKKSLMQEGYSPELLNLAGKTEVPKEASLVIIAGTKSPFLEPERNVLKKYLDQGGRMLFFADANSEAGLDKILAGFGIEIDKGIVADDKLAVNSPYVVMSQFYGEHEIARLLKQLSMTVLFPMSRGLTVLREGLPEGVKAEAVVLTSPFAWVETKPDDNPSPSDGEKTGQIPIVVAATKNTASATDKHFDEARVVVIGTSNIAIDPNWGHDPNRNLVMNSIAWATQQGNKITIRPPDRDISTIDIDKIMLAKIRFLATDLFPLALLGIGLAIWVTRRNK